MENEEIITTKKVEAGVYMLWADGEQTGWSVELRNDGKWNLVNFDSATVGTFDTKRKAVGNFWR